MREHQLQVRAFLQHAAEDQVMHGHRGIQRIADHVGEVVIAEAARLGEPGRVHEDRQTELFGLGEDPAEAVGRQVLAGDVGGDLDAAQSERSVQPFEFGDRKLRRLERHRAQADEAIRMAADDVGDVVVDRARGGDAEIGRRVVIGLVRRGRERLDVDPHHVHVGEALLHRGELHARPFAPAAG